MGNKISDGEDSRDIKVDFSKVEFKGEKRFLSNMFPCPILFKGDTELYSCFPDVFFDGLTYPSSEHIYQSLKSDNPNWKNKILGTPYPKKTKVLARKHLREGISIETDSVFCIRSDWNLIKLDVMAVLIFLKFRQNPELMSRLSSLQGAIEERNCWGDTFWGTVDGAGKNYLGKLLMLVWDGSTIKEIYNFVQKEKDCPNKLC